MALTRQNLTSLDGYDERIDWAGVLERTNRSLIRWVLGTGLLSFHLAVFTTVLLAIYTWNLISNPTDLHLLGPFRIWGVAALAHTLLVGGGLIGWRLFNMGDQVTAQPVPVYPRRSLPMPRQAPAPARSPGMAQAWIRGVTSTARANAGARRWREATAQQPPAAPPAPTATGWPAQPGMSAPAAAQPAEAERPPDVGEVTWPESPPLSTVLLGSTDHRGPADHVVAVDHRQSDTADDDPGRTWVDSFVESRSKDKENRWSWVEAAAASWLNRREISGQAEKALPASSEPTDETATPAAEQERRDETSATP
jgi:hypothetical protein